MEEEREGGREVREGGKDGRMDGGRGKEGLMMDGWINK